MTTMDKQEKEQKMPSAQEQVEELTATLQRLQAEFENYKKRTEIQQQAFVKVASKHILQKLLVTMDDVNRAIAHEDVSGLKHIHTNLHSLLVDEGVQPMDVLHQEFDPIKHEALMVEQVADKSKNNTVVEIFEQGYMLHDEVLRHAKVKVAKYEQEEKKNE